MSICVKLPAIKSSLHLSAIFINTLKFGKLVNFPVTSKEHFTQKQFQDEKYPSLMSLRRHHSNIN